MKADPRGSASAEWFVPLPPPVRKPWYRRPVLLAGLGVAALAVILGALFAAGVFTRQLMTVHGTEQVVVNSWTGMTTSAAFPDITAGSPVTVVNPAGQMIGTGVLAASDPSSWGPQDSVFSFTVTVPAGEARYGIEIGRNRGTNWFSPTQMRKGPAVFVSD